MHVEVVFFIISSPSFLCRTLTTALVAGEGVVALDEEDKGIQVLVATETTRVEEMEMPHEFKCQVEKLEKS